MNQQLTTVIGFHMTYPVYSVLRATYLHSSEISPVGDGLTRQSVWWPTFVPAKSDVLNNYLVLGWGRRSKNMVGKGLGVRVLVVVLNRLHMLQFYVGVRLCRDAFIGLLRHN